MRSLLILLTISLLSCFGCTQQTVNNPPASDQPGTTASKDSGTTTNKGGTTVVTKAVSKDDSAIATRVKTRLESNSEISPIKINIVTEDGIVTLTGTAPSPDAKNRVEQIVRDTEGVKRVANSITVVDLRAADGRTVGKTDEDREKISDAAILTRINSELVKSGIRGANVAVTNGQVLIKGEVNNSQEKIQVDVIARRTEGVKGVDNQLVVKGLS